MTVSIIIVNFKTTILVMNCLRSILENTHDISYEIIIIDNHSEDHIDSIIKTEFGDGIKFVMLNNNVGFGRANNEGIKVATGRNLFFLNPDTILKNNAIKILSDYMDTHSAVGACGGNLYDEEMKPALSYRRLFPGIRWELHEMTAHKIESIIYYGNWRFNHTNYPLNVAYITGADLMVKRSVINEVGSFSPLFFMYNEDTDLCLRIHRAGYKIQSIPTAHIQHLEGCSTKDTEHFFSEKGLMLSEQGRAIYYRKNVPPVRRAIAQLIYRCSLNMLSFISMFTRKHNSKAFQYRIKIINELYEHTD